MTRRSSPERRRLRFSFQFNNVKDPNRPHLWKNRPHRLAPDVGGGGYLSNPEFRVKSFFSKLFEPERRNPKTGARQSGQLLEKSANPVNRLF